MNQPAENGRASLGAGEPVEAGPARLDVDGPAEERSAALGVREPAGTAPARLGVRVRVENLTVAYGERTALHGVSLDVPAGGVLALVGESGSGKSTLAHAASRLLPPGARVTGGSVHVGDVDMAALRGAELRRARGSRVAYLPQDALAALNPVMTAGRQIAEVFRIAEGDGRRAARERAVEMLGRVGIRDPERTAGRYPHELSGGMRQRVVIAIALAHRPQLLIADEPTTALDVTVQAEVLALVAELRREFGITVIWITHDLSVTAEIADTVAVLYGGRLVEHASAPELFAAARHPYTRGLVDTYRDAYAGAPHTRYVSIPGARSDRSAGPGCPFEPRCPQAADRCGAEPPPVRAAAGDQLPDGAPPHLLACWEAH
ncbi:ABC transporter ATP-binding protein [Streptomyces pacificus]|uniref:ABC transporter ATP-binding protein n=1 Tax=Streptomyces pacificus TaxID=2705029 RepID=A0A6A0AZG9_9ACTN|nr:ABC transporter ATP-binding protein [Streptomyces pacificus]GFH38286.1 ABC transporter ATP-binding protein [Streptomyces pacificus]